MPVLPAIQYGVWISLWRRRRQQYAVSSSLTPGDALPSPDGPHSFDAAEILPRFFCDVRNGLSAARGGNESQHANAVAFVALK
jgi:hypothetical protein